MKTNRLLWMLLALAGCGPQETPPEPTGTQNTSPVTQGPIAPAPPIPRADPLPGDPPVAMTGFPCAVREVLQTNCASCHTGGLYVRSFTSRADFLADEGDGLTFGQRVVGRLSSSDTPMPPYAAERKPTADEVATVSAWVEQGMPAGACGDLAPARP